MTVGGYINGQWIEANDRDRFEVVNPAIGELLAQVPFMGAEEATLAIESGRAAMDGFVPDLQTRKQWLNGIAEHLLAGSESLAQTITQEQGKPIKESRAEVEYAASFFFDVAQRLAILNPKELPQPARGCTWTVHHRPAGVVGLITPWNFPLAMLAKKLASALGAGCASVLKPSELTPLSAMALVGICDHLGVPRGFVNLVFGDAKAIGEVLCTHPAVRIISFTGSTQVGKLLATQAGPHVKRVALELGGSAPFIVFDDADLDLSAEALIQSKFRAAGQTCVCADRILVDARVHDAFVAKVRPRVAALRCGNGMQEAADLGPLINLEGWNKVDRHVRDALRHGATRVVGDEVPQPPIDSATFYPPTLLTGITKEMMICREETFGPVLAVRRFETEAEAVHIANETEYGLAAYIMSGNESRVVRVTAKLVFGHVAVNSGTGPAAHAPFGGMKHSGYGREGGDEGLLEFTEPQVVALRR